jgi:hypothetical protein
LAGSRRQWWLVCIQGWLVCGWNVGWCFGWTLVGIYQHLRLVFPLHVGSQLLAQSEQWDVGQLFNR